MKAKTEYLVRAMEEELGDTYYKITVPENTPEEDVKTAFEMVKKYLFFRFDFCCGIANAFNITFLEVDKLSPTEYVEKGKAAFDEHFEKMDTIKTTHALKIFEYYIEDCMGWKVEEIKTVFAFEFEW